MGNKFGRRRQVVDEEYTRPQGLYPHKDIDHKKLRSLILDSKLAPCFPGLDECTLDLDECPICFLYYPSLNRSRCCRKMICTECFLQMKPPRSNRPTKCPFCKTTNYLVRYHGVRTKEEKRMEQVEEQRVIEAQIRMRQQELRDEEERIRKRKGISSSNSPAEVECQHISNTSHPGSCSVSASGWPSHLSQSRKDTFDVNLEDIMIFEAAWLSIQDHGAQENASGTGRNFSRQSSSQDCYTSPPGEVSAPAQLQHLNGDSALISSSNPVYNAVHLSGSSSVSMKSEVGSYPSESWTKLLSNNRKDSPRDYNELRTSHEAREEGISFSLSESVEAASHLIPDNFEEQMMLTMAISLAEFQAWTRSSLGVTWLQ